MFIYIQFLQFHARLIFAYIYVKGIYLLLFYLLFQPTRLLSYRYDEIYSIEIKKQMAVHLNIIEYNNIGEIEGEK